MKNSTQTVALQEILNLVQLMERRVRELIDRPEGAFPSETLEEEVLILEIPPTLH